MQVSRTDDARQTGVLVVFIALATAMSAAIWVLTFRLAPAVCAPVLYLDRWLNLCFVGDRVILAVLATVAVGTVAVLVLALRSLFRRRGMFHLLIAGGAVLTLVGFCAAALTLV